jgi:hypothetical protein
VVGVGVTPMNFNSFQFLIFLATVGALSIIICLIVTVWQLYLWFAGEDEPVTFVGQLEERRRLFR